MKIELDLNDTDTLQRLKDKAMMLKVICLDEIGKSPMVNVSNMVKRDKVKLKVEIEKKWDTMNDADILKLFNEICIQTIFDTNGPEAEILPVGISNRPELPEQEITELKTLPAEEQMRRCGQVFTNEVVA
jgi:hypothetical protein